MQHHVFHTLLDPNIDTITEQLRVHITKTPCGVTLSGNRLTVRWYDDKGNLVSVHMVILEVNDGKPDPEFEDK